MFPASPFFSCFSTPLRSSNSIISHYLLIRAIFLDLPFIFEMLFCIWMLEIEAFNLTFLGALS